MGCGCLVTVCEFIFAIILPPVTVFLRRGCGADLLINICLTILGWIPGSLHALYIMHHYPKTQTTV